LAGIDEAFYLSTYPDVAEAIGQGLYTSGEDHFRKLGRADCRMYRLRYQGMP
jgi:hypothetical protein